MAIRVWKVGAVTALAALTSACASMGGKRTEPDQSLAGSWVMNVTDSETGLPGDSASRGSGGHGGRAGAGSGGRGGRAGGGGMSGGRGGMGGGAGGMRGGAPAVDFATVRAAFESILARQERLVLHIEHDVVQVRASTGAPIRLRLDARWEEETFTRQRGTDRLIVTISVHGAGPTHRDMVVVYDLDEPTSPRPGPVDRSAGPPGLAARGL
jgi:hypothetical protein